MSTISVLPIGKIIRKEGHTYIIIGNRFRKGLKGIEGLNEIEVIYWFDRNDSSDKRKRLEVHPKGDPGKPLRGVFATHAPLRPNLIGISRCKIISVNDHIIEIEEIDAMDNTPVIDIKS